VGEPIERLEGPLGTVLIDQLGAGIQLSSSAEMRWPTASRGVHPSGASGVSSRISGSPSSSERTTCGVRSNSTVVSARKVLVTVLRR